jgi:hypothetical protein
MLKSHFLALVHGSDNHLFRRLHKIRRAAYPKRPTVEPKIQPIRVDHGISPPMGPVIPELCEVLASHLLHVQRQITHQALGHQHQPILAQACKAPPPPLINIPTIELIQIPRSIGI